MAKALSKAVTRALEHGSLFTNHRVEVGDFVEAYATEFPMSQNDDLSVDEVRMYFSDELEEFEKYPVAFWFENAPKSELDQHCIRTTHCTVTVHPIETTCSNSSCGKEGVVHHPGIADSNVELQRAYYEVLREVVDESTFPLAFTCCSCRGGALLFLIRRNGYAFQVVGRSKIPTKKVPPQIPKRLHKWFGNAHVALLTGYPVASALYFRILIEKHWRVALGLSEDEKLDGETLSRDYNKLLSDEFPSSQRNLKASWDICSVVVHSGEASVDDLSDIGKKIEGHFLQLQLTPSPEKSLGIGEIR